MKKYFILAIALLVFVFPCKAFSQNYLKIIDQIGALGENYRFLENFLMMTEAEYTQYIKDFNEACTGDGTAFGAFFDKYYETDTVFEYIPNATKNYGKEITVSFWKWRKYGS